MAVGEAKIASPCELAMHGEAARALRDLVLLLEASLALFISAFALSEAH